MNKVKIPERAKILLWLVGSSLLCSLTLQWDALWVLSYVALAPLFFHLIRLTEEKARYRRLYGHTLIWMLVYHLSVYSFFWKMYPMKFLGLTPVPAFFVVLFCQVGLSTLQALPMAAIGPLFRLFHRHRKLSPILFAALWVILEWLQGFTWAGVPFLRLSLSQTSMIPAMQSASLFGSLFLSFLTALVNGCIGIGFYYLHVNGRACKAVRLFPLLGIGLIGLNLGFGLLRMAARSNDRAKEIPVALIQANIGSLDKWSGGVEATVERHQELIRKAGAESGAKIILLPETALNFDLLSDSYAKIRQSFVDLAKQTDAILFIGTFTNSEDADTGEILEYNSLVAFFPDGRIEQEPYSKRRLVPFGEYVPMKGLIETLLPFLADMNLFDGDLTPGRDSAILSTRYGKIGRLICFDSIYDRLTLSSVRDGAEILLLSTNDSWYTDSAAVRMHNDHAKLRAVESGRYVLRAANTGISSILTPLGGTQAELAALKEGYVVGTAAFSSDRTLYSYIGNLIVLLCAAVPAFEAGWKIWERRKKR